MDVIILFYFYTTREQFFIFYIRARIIRFIIYDSMNTQVALFNMTNILLARSMYSTSVASMHTSSSSTY